MTKQQPKLKVGQKVFIINSKLEIEEKRVNAIVLEKEEIKYQLDEHSCSASERTEIFMSKQKAQVSKKNFLDGLRFGVGDLVVVKYKEYSRTQVKVGLISELSYFNSPYKITFGDDRYTRDILDSDIILKVKNEFIENFGNILELQSKFEETKKELNHILSEIGNEYEVLEKELKQKFKQQYPWYSEKKKPMFKDMFEYEANNDY